MEAGIDIKFYRERWKAVEEIERKELRAAFISKNWQEQFERRQYAIAHGIDPEKMEIWARWAKLKELYESGVWSGRPKDE